MVVKGFLLYVVVGIAVFRGLVVVGLGSGILLYLVGENICPRYMAGVDGLIAGEVEFVDRDVVVWDSACAREQ